MGTASLAHRAAEKAFPEAVIQHLPAEGRASYSAVETAYSVVARAYELGGLEDVVGDRRSCRREALASRLVGLLGGLK
jgi:hypothetical protein